MSYQKLREQIVNLLNRTGDARIEKIIDEIDISPAAARETLGRMTGEGILRFNVMREKYALI